jgi:hypothetical protein
MSPKLNRKRTQSVLTKIDEILASERRSEAERDTRFVELGRYLCEVRAGQYWRLETLKSLDEFWARRFPESRRKAYYLMSIHEHLPPQARKDGGVDEGAGVGESCQEGWAGVRLCHLAAQSALIAKGSVQAGGGEGAYRAGIGTSCYHLDRVSVGHCSKADFLSGVEMLPRLRSIGDLWCEQDQARSK